MLDTIIALKNTKRNRSFVEEEMMKNGEYGPIYVFMSTVLPVHVVTGTIDFPSDFPGRLKLAKEIVLACTDNANVAIDPLVISGVSETVKDYENSTAGDRPGKFTNMNQSIKDNLLAPFQKAANAKPVDSIVILQSGKFHVKDQAVHKEKVFEAAAGTEKGTAVLSSGGGGAVTHLHLWSSSADGITYKYERSTNYAYTTLTGYVSEKPMWFIHELSIKDVPQGASNPIRIMIK